MLRRSDVSARAFAEVWLWRHGWVWPVAALLAAATMTAFFTVSQPQRADLSELKLQTDQARSAFLQRPASAAAVTSTDARAVIDASAPADQLVARMIQLAQAEGIALPQSEYQQHLMADSTVLQVQVAQPVRATYPQLRRYIEAVLRAVPNASLDQLNARRENVGQPQLDAKLRWSLWLPSSAGSKAGPALERPTL